MTEWREGAWGALLMGLRHGRYCVGCCWVLMALLFVTGVMNLLWVEGMAAFEPLRPSPRGDAAPSWIHRLIRSAILRSISPKVILMAKSFSRQPVR